MFRDFLVNSNPNNGISSRSVIDPKTISVYPVSEYNLEGIKILYNNSMRMGHDNINIEVASINPSLWMGDILDKHWTKIAYVCALPFFSIMKVDGDNIVEKQYTSTTDRFNTDKELDTFFDQGTWKRFVLFSIVKYADLSTMRTHYMVRYADITEKFEYRDNKINDILDGANNN